MKPFTVKVRARLAPKPAVVASEKPVLTTSSEDTSIGAYLSPELRERLSKEKKKVVLQGSYC